jgi:hypothetical protein
LVTISRSRRSARSRVAGRKLRTVPTSLTWSGTTLKAPTWLVCIEQMLTTTASTGSTLRLAMVCSALMICAQATTGSTTRCGMAPWPPRPRTVICTSSVAAITGPGRTAICPAGKPGQLCTA